MNGIEKFSQRGCGERCPMIEQEMVITHIHDNAGENPMCWSKTSNAMEHRFMGIREAVHLTVLLNTSGDFRTISLA
jgi:hypothetical protein